MPQDAFLAGINRVERNVVRADGDQINPLRLQNQRDFHRVGTKGREKAVIMARAPTQPTAVAIKREPWNENPVHLRWIDQGSGFARFRDSSITDAQVFLQGVHLVQGQSLTLSVDFGEDEIF